MAKNKPDSRGGRGSILNVSSVSATDGQFSQVGYGSSKKALDAVALPMARDLGKFGIRVNSISPSMFITPMSDFLPEANRKFLLKNTALGRFGE